MRQIGMGLMFGLFVVFASQGNAQITKSVKSVTNTVKKPLKEVQSTTKEVTQPVKDVSRGVKDVTRAPQDVKNEVKRTTGEFDRAGNEVKRVGSDVNKATSGLKSDKDKDDKDSTAARNSGDSGGTVVIDERRNRDEVPGDGEVDISHNPDLPQSTAKTTTKAPDPFEIRAPAKKTEPVANSGDRGVHVPPPASSTHSVPKAQRPKPDHSKSPARYALERADFDLETLEDLFASAEWDGPGSAHTHRSIEFTLRQLKTDIAEIKQTDPNADTSYYSSRYKELYAEFTRRSRDEEKPNEAVIEDL